MGFIGLGGSIIKNNCIKLCGLDFRVKVIVLDCVTEIRSHISHKYVVLI